MTAPAAAPSLTEAAESYLTIRRALGHTLVPAGQLLDAFVQHVHATGASTVTVEVAVGWAAEAGSRGQTARRLSLVRGFAAYLSAFDPAAELIPEHLVATGVVRRTPYLFSPAEIDALMTAAGSLKPPLRAAGFATLIGLMAATGLRTGEALRLDVDDIDLTAGHLLVRYSKYGKSRRIPLHPSTVGALADYTRRRDQLCPQPSVPAFLLSPDGGRLGGAPISETFRRLLRMTDIAAPPGRRAPRLYDLRHTFAVTTLRGWHTDGGDVQARLPLLSLYLGHINPAHTYWYLQAAPELMSVLADRLDRSLRDRA